MYELKKIGKVFMSKFVVSGPSSHKKIIYRAAVSQRLRNTSLSYTQCTRNTSSTLATLNIIRQTCPNAARSTLCLLHIFLYIIIIITFPERCKLQRYSIY